MIPKRASHGIPGGGLKCHSVRALSSNPFPRRFKGPPAGAAARRFLAIFQKIGFFENLVKIGFWDGFGSIWAPESSSA